MDNHHALSPTSQHLSLETYKTTQQDSHRLSLLNKLENQAAYQLNYKYAFSPTGVNAIQQNTSPANLTGLQEFQKHTPTISSLISPNSSHPMKQQQEQQLKLQTYELVERPLKSQTDTISSIQHSLPNTFQYQPVESFTTTTPQLDSIYQRIQNLRKNLTEDTQNSAMYGSSENNKLAHQPSQVTFTNQNNLQCTFRKETVGLSSVNSEAAMRQDSSFLGNSQKFYQPSDSGQQHLQSLRDLKDLKENLSPQILSTREDQSTQQQHQQSFNTKQEEQIRHQVEGQFHERVVELEKRSLYLDKSLTLIEEMKSKFQHFETQQNSYNDLLEKYNNLLYHVGANQQHSDRQNDLSGNIQQNNTSYQEMFRNNYSPYKPTNRSTDQEEHPLMQGPQQHPAERPESDRLPLKRIDNLIRPVLPHGEKRRKSKSQERSVENKKQIPRSPGASLRIKYGVVKTQPSSTTVRRKRNQSLSKSHEHMKFTRPCNHKHSDNAVLKDQKIEAQNMQMNVDLHKKIEKLTKEKAKLEHLLQRQLVTQPPQEQQILQCCCNEMRQIYEDRVQSLEQISEHWRSKTQLLVSKYYKSLQVVREDQQRLKQVATDSLGKMAGAQDEFKGQILQKQMEMQVYYEKRLKKADKENKKMTKRVVLARQQK